MKRLAGGRSPRWAWFERFDVPDYDDPTQTYLTRWRIVQTPWGGLYLHRLSGPDPRRTLHDHPWGFLSIVLRGGYWERRLDPATMEVKEHVVRRWNRVRAHDAHAIVHLRRMPTWTLLFVGRRIRTWGYWDQGWPFYPASWVWTAFDQHAHAAEFDRALAARKATQPRRR